MITQAYPLNPSVNTAPAHPEEDPSLSHHRARRRFGQNFLYDPQVINTIVDTINPSDDEHLIEIGPGRGALTDVLVECAGRIDLIEIDRDLYHTLRLRYRHASHVTLHLADILRFDLTHLVTPESKCRIVGNLPYNISTPLLFHLLDAAHYISDMHIMLQREVAERLVSIPGKASYGRLSVMTQYRCQTTRLFDISPHAFRPVPKIFSSMVWLRPHTVAPVKITDEEAFHVIVTRCFNHRRKTLRNCLKGYLTESQIHQCHIDPKARPQTLSLSDFALLSDVFSEKKLPTETVDNSVDKSL